jgi:hypothetical protein
MEKRQEAVSCQTRENHPQSSSCRKTSRNFQTEEQSKRKKRKMVKEKKQEPNLTAS